MAMFMAAPVRLVSTSSSRNVAARPSPGRKPIIQYVVSANSAVGSTRMGTKSNATVAVKYDAVP